MNVASICTIHFIASSHVFSIDKKSQMFIYQISNFCFRMKRQRNWKFSSLYLPTSYSSLFCFQHRMNQNTNCWMLSVHWHTFVVFYKKKLWKQHNNSKRDFSKVTGQPFLFFSYFHSISWCMKTVLLFLNEIFKFRIIIVKNLIVNILKWI